MLAVVFYPKEIPETVISFRKKYDCNSGIIPAHITIVSPIENIGPDLFIKHVENKTQNLKSFTIRLKGISKTDDGCLFLMVEQSKEKIIEIHDHLYTGTLETYLPTKYPFVPHITIADFVSVNDERIGSSYTEALNLNLEFNCLFDNLTVVEGDGITPAKSLKRYEF